jgi:SAM-dependent methyltransferase
MKLIERSCYNCNSKESDYYDSENGFVLVKCKKCGLLYVNPRPKDEDISKAIILGVHKGEKEKSVTGRYSRSRINNYLKVLSDFFPKETLQKNGLKWLDVGCGFGEFIEALENYSNKNLSVRGTDPNENKILSARKRNLNVSSVDFDDHDIQYDYISLLNVYSHLPDPIEFLSNLKNKLKPKGELFLETGHSSHLPPKYHHKPYDLPDHLSFANREILVGILEKIGFEIIDVKIYRPSCFTKYYEMKSVAKLLAKIVLGKGGRISNLFPKYPNGDMYIRCKLIN